MRGTRRIDRLWIAVAACVVLGGAGAALAQSALQLTPDGKRTLINKQVGAERWAITLNADDSSVTGNVFEPVGQAQFLFCTPGLTDDPAEVALSCESAPPCLASPCSPTEWQFADDVTLPLSFFEPPGPTPTPVPTQPLDRMQGHWRFDYTGGTSPTVIYSFGEIRYQFGTPVLIGTDPAGAPVSMTYGSTFAPPALPYAMLAVGDTACLLNLFQLVSPDGIAGTTYVTGKAADGSCLGVGIGQPGSPLTGQRLLDAASAQGSGSADDTAALARLVDLLQSARR